MANPLKLADASEPRLSVPQDPTERRRFWVERGNRVLWGQEATKDGTFLTPQLGLEWACTKDGHYFIEPRRSAES